MALGLLAAGIACPAGADANPDTVGVVLAGRVHLLSRADIADDEEWAALWSLRADTLLFLSYPIRKPVEPSTHGLPTIPADATPEDAMFHRIWALRDSVNRTEGMGEAAAEAFATGARDIPGVGLVQRERASVSIKNSYGHLIYATTFRSDAVPRDSSRVRLIRAMRVNLLSGEWIARGVDYAFNWPGGPPAAIRDAIRTGAAVDTAMIALSPQLRSLLRDLDAERSNDVPR